MKESDDGVCTQNRDQPPTAHHAALFPGAVEARGTCIALHDVRLANKSDLSCRRLAHVASLLRVLQSMVQRALRLASRLADDQRRTIMSKEKEFMAQASFCLAIAVLHILLSFVFLLAVRFAMN